MDPFASLTADLDAARVVLGDVLGEVLPEATEAGATGTLTVAAFERLTDTEVVQLAELMTRVGRAAEQLRIAATAVISRRSPRRAGHAGLAQSRGYPNATAMVQQLIGVGRGEAARQVRVGEALLAEHAAPVAECGAPAGAGAGAGVDAYAGTGTGAESAAAALATPPELHPWHHPLNAALRSGALSSAQHDAIRRGLGEPPAGTTPSGDASPEAIAAWRAAAQHLADHAGGVTVEALGRSARVIRAQLDPEGATARYQQRFEARSFRMWVDRDGRRRASLVCDDEAGAWLQGVLDAALAPRRGGVRFIDAEAQQRAKLLTEDPRTNEQLTYDLLIDTLRAGTPAQASDVFGVQQAGVRIVQFAEATEGAEGAEITATHGAASMPGGAASMSGSRRRATATFEHSGEPAPVAIADQRVCDTGTVQVTTASNGDPLRLGRAQRTFSSRQRLALAIRDGGCLWPACDRPPAMCEAHHIDPWRQGGRTDVERGVLLCRFHLVQLHHQGWRITRDAAGALLLHAPPGRTRAPAASLAPRELVSRRAIERGFDRSSVPHSPVPRPPVPRSPMPRSRTGPVRFISSEAPPERPPPGQPHTPPLDLAS